MKGRSSDGFKRGGKGRPFFRELHVVYLAAYSVDFNTWLESGFIFFRLASVCAWIMQAGLQLEVCVLIYKSYSDDLSPILTTDCSKSLSNCDIFMLYFSNLQSAFTVLLF